MFFIYQMIYILDPEVVFESKNNFKEIIYE